MRRRELFTKLGVLVGVGITGTTLRQAPRSWPPQSLLEAAVESDVNNPYQYTWGYRQVDMWSQSNNRWRIRALKAEKALEKLKQDPWATDLEATADELWWGR